MSGFIGEVEAVDELLPGWAQFRLKLLGLKEQIPLQADWNWYPYGSIDNGSTLARLFATAGFSIRELITGGPVLDIGCADGDWGFYLESLGAEVDMLDNAPTNYNQMQGVQTLTRELGSMACIQEQNIDLDFTPHRHYRVCFALGLLYHLKNPYRFLEQLKANVDYCILSTRVAQRFPELTGCASQSAVAYLLDPVECNQDNTNFWIFSDAGLRRLLARTGWQIRAYIHAAPVTDSNPVDADRDERAFCLLQRTDLRPWRKATLLEGWYRAEPEGFRWTGARFSLRAEQSGQLRLTIYVAAALLSRSSVFSLEGRAGARNLGSESFHEPGLYVYSRQVWADEEVTFTTSPALPPHDADPRELGVIVASIDVY